MSGTLYNEKKSKLGLSFDEFHFDDFHYFNRYAGFTRYNLNRIFAYI